MKKLIKPEYTKAAIYGVVGAIAVGGVITLVRMLPDNSITKPIKTVSAATIQNR